MDLIRKSNKIEIVGTDVNVILDLENIYNEYVSHYPSIKRWNDEVDNSYHWLFLYHLTRWTEGYLSHFKKEKFEGLYSVDGCQSVLINEMFHREGKYYEEFFLCFVDWWFDYWDDFCDVNIPSQELIQIKEVGRI